ncbi:MAG: hypothetical protein ACQEW0_16225 [Pseudomonadota bacterium]
MTSINAEVIIYQMESLCQQRRGVIIDTIKALKLDDQMPKGWEAVITAEHVIILPQEMEDKTPDASRLSFIRFDKHLPPGRCLIVKTTDMF